MDALLKLEAWIESEKANYQRNKGTMTYEALSKEIERQSTFLEIQVQIIRCKHEETQEYLDEAFPVKQQRKTFQERLCEEVQKNAKENFTTGL